MSQTPPPTAIETVSAARVAQLITSFEHDRRAHAPDTIGFDRADALVTVLHEVLSRRAISMAGDIEIAAVPDGYRWMTGGKGPFFGQYYPVGADEIVPLYLSRRSLDTADGVERFEPFADQDDGEFKGMGAVPDGDWVRYSDYAALTSRTRNTETVVKADQIAGYCATEGCDNAGTERFEAGGVGSVYCPSCLAKIKALAITEPEREPEPAFWPPIVELGRILGVFADALKYNHLWTALRQADYDKANLALQALAASPPSPAEVTPTHRHVKRGSEYVLIGIGRMQAERWTDGTGSEMRNSVDMREVAIYRSVDDGSLWARPREEFEDGRFEALQLGKEG